MATIRISELRQQGGNDVNIYGPTNMNLGNTATFIITDFDAFSEYSVSTSLGVASRVDDEITVTLPFTSVNNYFTLIVTKNRVSRTIQVAIGGASIVTPDIISPAIGTEGVSGNLTLQANDFRTSPIGAGSVLKSEWQIAADPGFATIASQGEVTTGDVTRYTASGLEGNTRYYARMRYFGVGMAASNWSATVWFSTSATSIAKPSLTIVGDSFNVKETPKFDGSVFSVSPAGSDTHVSSTWILMEGGTEVWRLNNSPTDKLSTVLPKGVLQTSKQYTMQVQYNGGVSSSMLSDKLSFTTAASFNPIPGQDAGVPFGGGYYAGANIVVDGVEYALVVAPKSLGGERLDDVLYKNTNTATSGASSLNDGWSNTLAMIAAGGSSAATFCRSLTIGGYNDWYLPSRDELEIIYRYLKPTTAANTTSSDGRAEGGVTGTNLNSIPQSTGYTTTSPTQTTVTLFREGGGESFSTYIGYLTSTQYGSTSAVSQTFLNGEQEQHVKASQRNARAVRRVPI